MQGMPAKWLSLPHGAGLAADSAPSISAVNCHGEESYRSCDPPESYPRQQGLKPEAKQRRELLADRRSPIQDNKD